MDEVYIKVKNKKIQISQKKLMNDIVEQDHRQLKRRITIATGFKELEILILKIINETASSN
jgi:transposase-like protein